MHFLVYAADNVVVLPFTKISPAMELDPLTTEQYSCDMLATIHSCVVSVLGPKVHTIS